MSKNKKWSAQMMEANRLKWEQGETSHHGIAHALKISGTQAVKLIRPKPDYLRQKEL
jgi:hypothetical protein